MAKILLIDDDRDLVDLTKITLVKAGYQVSILHTATNVLEKIKELKPDLIIMDIMMPGISGAEAVRNLKRDHEFKNMPVIFLTGLISGEEEEVEKTGINIEGKSYKTLGKPYEISELLELVKNTLIKG